MSKVKNLANLTKLSRLASTKYATAFETKLPNTDYIPPVYEGPDFDTVQAIREKNLNSSFTPYYRKPLLIHSGKMQWLFDHEGKRYLDMFGGIVTVSVGHCHPYINEALTKQMNKLWHTTSIYMHPKVHEYAERLTNMLPKGLDCVYFVNSGSEANDLAVNMARLYTGNYDVISFRNGYHGGSPTTIGLTAVSTWKYPIPGVNNGINHAMNPDVYKGLWGGKHCRDSPVQTNRDCSCMAGECQASKNYLGQLEEIFKYTAPGKKCAGMFAESIQGVGGTVQYPKGYIKEAAKMVRAHGGLFISDEVQTGFGRTGDHFWGYEGHGIVPDIVTMAKGIGNGFPLGAVVTRREIIEVLKQSYHFNTFGGNPLASTCGIAVLDVIEDEKLQENALNIGNYFFKGLTELRDQYEVVGDVRGKGLMISIELVQDKESRVPLNSQQVLDIFEQCKDLGVLIGKGGLYGNVLRIAPPMCITKNDVDFTLDVFRTSLEAHKIKYL